MARINRNRSREGRRTRPGAPAARSTGREAAKGPKEPKDRKDTKTGKASWFASKGPVLRFVLILGGLMAAFNLLFYTNFFIKGDAFNTYLAWNAKVSAAILGLLGDDAQASGITLSTPRFSLSLKAGCDALQTSAFFVFAVLASPASISWMARLVPMLLGTAALIAMNVVRIVSLYYTGVHFPNAFEIMHVDVWQAVFIFMPIFFWIAWYRWATRSKEPKPDVAT